MKRGGLAERLDWIVFGLLVMSAERHRQLAKKRDKPNRTNPLSLLAKNSNSFLCGRRSEASKEMELPWRGLKERGLMGLLNSLGGYGAGHRPMLRKERNQPQQAHHPFPLFNSFSEVD